MRKNKSTRAKSVKANATKQMTNVVSVPWLYESAAKLIPLNLFTKIIQLKNLKPLKKVIFAVKLHVCQQNLNIDV